MIYDSLWGFVIIGGPLVIAIALAYALLTRRRLTVSEKRRQHRAVEKLYEEPAAEAGATKSPARKPSVERVDG
ncbi:MAG: hypothetical protein AB7I79_11910 [Rhizobiaceae bacterium]